MSLRALASSRKALSSASSLSLTPLSVSAQTMKALVTGLHENQKPRGDSKLEESLRDHSKRTFINRTSTLVALLVVNERKDEAEAVAAQALKEMDDPKLRAELEKAKKGTVPEPWP